MPGYRGFLCLLFGTSLALIQRSLQEKQAKILRLKKKKISLARGSHIAAIGHVPHAHPHVVQLYTLYHYMHPHVVQLYTLNHPHVLQLYTLYHYTHMTHLAHL